MVVKVFTGDSFSEYEHEWNQFMELYNLIDKKYKNSDESIYILSDFMLANNQIDILILAEKGMAIIDLKSYKGNIIGSESGNWIVVNDNEIEIPIPKNLFKQLKSQKYSLIDKINLIQKGNFEHIEGEKLVRINCYGYFEKGSNYSMSQIGRGAHKWFGVITGDTLLEKINFINAGYRLRPKDMDAIVKGLNLKEFSFEKGQKYNESIFETNYKKELSVFIPPKNWNEMKEKIFNSNILTIAGQPYIGKSTTMVNVVSELKTKGYEIRDEKDSLIKLFESTDENDKEQFIKLMRGKNVFIFDDLFGNSEYEPRLGNKWVPLIIKFLNSSKIESIFVISSRMDILDKFLSSNKELNIRGLKDVFTKSIIELNFSDYDGEKRKEIFDKNLEYIQLKEENKKSIRSKNEKILNELVLPGEMWFLFENAKDNDFQEYDIDIELNKVKTQVNIFKEQIKSLNESEKLFLYNLYINHQDFSAEDLEMIYSSCLYPDLTEGLFFDCVKKFEGKIIKIKIENELLSNKTINKFDFTHPIYIESIEKLLKEDKSESELFDRIIFRIYDLLKMQIRGFDEYKHYLLQFNIFKKICSAGKEQTKDIVFEILNTITEYYDPEIEDSINVNVSTYWLNNMFSTEDIKLNTYVEDSEYFVEFLNNYGNLDDEIARNYLLKPFQNNSENPFIKYVIANSLAFDLESKSVKNVKFLLNEFSKFSKDYFIDVPMTIFILRNHNEFNELEKKNLECFFNYKHVQIPLLIPYLAEDDGGLKNILINLISNAETQELREGIPHVLLNYNYLPPQVIEKYEFIFKSLDEGIMEKVGEAFENWIYRFMKNPNKSAIEWSHLNKEVRDLFIIWLKKGYYSRLLYGYSTVYWYWGGDRLLYKWIYHSSDQNKRSCVAIPLELKEAIEVNIISLLKNLKSSDHLFYWEDVPGEGNTKIINLSEKNNVEWVKKTRINKTEEGRTSFRGIDWVKFNINKDENLAILKSMNSFEDKIDSHEIDWFKVKDEGGKISLFKKPLEKAEVMWVAFILSDKEKPELEEAIIKAIEDDNTILKAFYGDCKHLYEYPFELSDYQSELLNRMLQYADDEMLFTLEGFIDKKQP